MDSTQDPDFYETIAIQDETDDSMLRTIYDNPLFALEWLHKHREKFSKEKYNLIVSRINNRSNLPEK